MSITRNMQDFWVKLLSGYLRDRYGNMWHRIHREEKDLL
jgi:hypothetical protein